MTPFLLRSALPALAAALCLPSALGRPDEGQWLPQQIREMNWAALEARGMQLTKDEFWHPEKGGVLSAAVQIGGCSASFVSSDGLVVTNHHCGFGAVNRLSTPERNYLRDGFVAGDREAELPAPGMVVYVVRRIQNVTDRVHAAQEDASSPVELWAKTQQVIEEIVAEGEKEPDTSCSVASFFEGREYHLYYRTKLTDVRLVYAPPRSVGEYGGEVDNWEWPRHTGDFTFFRAYAAPDGSPRGYQADNVPYRPDHWLRVSSDGVQEDDLVMILGYPGRTERYLTSVAVADREGVYYPMRYAMLTDMIAVLEAHARTSDQAQLDYASTIKSLANVQKNADGMVWGLARNKVVQRKQREEQQFSDWVAGSSEREQKYGSILEDLKSVDRQEQETTRKDLALSLSLSSRTNPFLRGLVDLVSTAIRMQPGSEVPESMVRRFGAAMDKDFDAVNKPLMAIALDELRRLDGADTFRARAVLRPDEKRPTDEVLEDLLGESKLTTPAGRLALLRGGAPALRGNEDPLVQLAIGLAMERDELVGRQRQFDGKRIELGREWISAQQAWRGTSFYPDANSTLRVSIASVKGYEPRDGVEYVPHTTVAGVLRKHTGEEPFDAPAALREAATSRTESAYFDAKIGDVPSCFLSDGDTTGGNSGSPVINGKGELVGLNFDRVFENVSGDFGWNADRSRNISVDIRFVLWHLESVMPAHHLLREMGVPAGAR